MLLPQIIAKPSDAHGLGLFATEAIPRGTVVWHPCMRCPVFPAAQMTSLGPSQTAQLDEYGYFLDDHSSVILPCGLAFLMNHACEANVLDYGLDFGIAVRDIAANEEVTCDYRTFASDPAWEVRCSCRASDCAGTVGPAKGLTHGLTDRWLSKVTRALESFDEASQPLAGSLAASSRGLAAAASLPDPQRYSIRRRVAL